MRSYQRNILLCIFLLHAFLVASNGFSQCVPWQDSTVSVSQLKVPAKAHNAFLQALTAVRNMDEPAARNALSRALKVDPNYAAALTMAGLFALEDSRLDDANHHIKAALEVDPEYYGAFLALAAVENAKHNYEEAEQLTNAAMSACSSFWRVYYQQAESLIGRRQYATALAILRKA